MPAPKPPTCSREGQTHAKSKSADGLYRSRSRMWRVLRRWRDREDQHHDGVDRPAVDRPSELLQIRSDERKAVPEGTRRPHQALAVELTEAS